MNEIAKLFNGALSNYCYVAFHLAGKNLMSIYKKIYIEAYFTLV